MEKYYKCNEYMCNQEVSYGFLHFNTSIQSNNIGLTKNNQNFVNSKKLLKLLYLTNVDIISFLKY